MQVRVHDSRAWSALVRGGSTGLGEGYVRGWWDCDDLTALVRIALRAMRRTHDTLDRLGQARARLTDPVSRLRRPRPARDRQQVHAHYDISNDFFATMLDETMTYSSALFERPDMGLAAAQRAKMDRICRLLDLGPGDELLEIGTGWGGFAIHAASHYGCRVTTTTISDAQFDLARERVAAAELDRLVTVRPDHYRDLRGRFTKLASIEMFEAVDWRDHDEFFATCARLLEPGGLMAMQTIVIEDQAFDRAKHHDDFIKRFVFPGGCLPSVKSIVASATRGAFRVRDLRDIGEHYPETLRRWRANIDTDLERLESLQLDDSFGRLWTFYLCYCEAGFLERRVSDIQVLLENRGRR